jgi:hypothetical protein
MAQPITNTIGLIGNGSFSHLVGDDMAELVKAVDDTGKAGKLVITISVSKATAGAMKVTAAHKVTTPAERKTEAPLFGTPEGNLQADKPTTRTSGNYRWPL